MRTFALIDDQLVEDSLHLRRTLGLPELRCKEPLVREAEAFGGVLKDKSGLWRMWYIHNVARDPAKHVVGMDSLQSIAYSRDGLNWEFPNLGLVAEAGSKSNNIIIGPHQRDAAGRYLTGYGGTSGFCIVDAETDPHPAARARFTVMTHSCPTDTIGGICMYHSDDGLVWQAYPENPVIIGSQDTQNCFFFDPRTRRYVCYQRPTIYCGVDRHANRKIARLDSDDLVHWGISRVVLDTDEADAPAWQIFDEPGMRGARGRDKQFQGITVFPCHNTYLAFTWFYDVLKGTFVNELLHSDDGWLWKREALREPIIADGRPEGFRGKIIVPMASPPVLDGDDLFMYMSCGPYGHHEIALSEFDKDREKSKSLLETNDIYVMSIKRDRWISYDAGETEGELLTTPVAWEGGGRLLLNMHIDAGGYMKVNFEDAWSRPIPECHLDEIPPIEGPLEAIDHNLTFGPGPKTVVKFPPSISSVRMRFRMKKAKLFGWALEG